jgi:hypothetical protein
MIALELAFFVSRRDGCCDTIVLHFPTTPLADSPKPIMEEENLGAPIEEDLPREVVSLDGLKLTSHAKPDDIYIGCSGTNGSKVPRRGEGSFHTSDTCTLATVRKHKVGFFDLKVVVERAPNLRISETSEKWQRKITSPIGEKGKIPL